MSEDFMFALHPRLAADTVEVGEFALSKILLSKDANYPWCILVPKVAGISEIHQLSEAQQVQLIGESSRLALAMVTIFSPQKMNVAALGNMVPQLHVHHVARFETDCAWPQPIWGRVSALEYSDTALSDRLTQLREALKGEGFVSVE